MRNRVVGIALAGVLGLVGFGLLASSFGGDDEDRVDAAAGADVTTAAGAPAQLAAARDEDGEPVELVGIPTPPELARVTLQLEPQRALGGLVTPGELVAVTASFDRSQGAEATETGPQTGVILEKILVTAVQVEEPAGDADDPTPPRGTLLVTLAVPPTEASRLVFAAEYGRVWLAGEVPATPETGRAPVNFATINTVVPA